MTTKSSLLLSHEPATHVRILVADDSAPLRAAIRGVFKLLGHAADVVANGLEATEAAAAGIYDLVILDIQMPRMGGYEAARLIRSQDARSTRIIGMSGDVDSQSAYQAAGMDDFLVKPVRMEDLSRVVADFKRQAVSVQLRDGICGELSDSGGSYRRVHAL